MNQASSRSHLFAVVLAGGDGSRLRELTTNAHGLTIPKQFCSFDGSRSLLGATIDRAERLVDAERVLIAVSEKHRMWWEEELADRGASSVLVQPCGRGTAPAILLGLMEAMRRDRDAIVVVLPSDHCVENEATLQCALEEAVAAVAEQRERVVLLGIIPDAPESSYGWILPALETDGVTHLVQAFVEKPEHDVANGLLERGALWNAFLVVGTARQMVALYRKALPELFLTFARYFEDACGDRRTLRAIYEDRPTQDFSRDVLERVPESLRVLEVAPCGWTDVGTPARAIRCLARDARTVLGGERSGAAWIDLTESVARAFGAAPGGSGGWKTEDVVLF